MPDATNRLANTQVNMFQSSFQSMPTQTRRLIEALEAIRTGVYRSAVNRVRQVLARDGKRAYDQAKAHLPAFTFGGTFAPSRGNAHLQQHTGIVHTDLDDLPDVAAAKQAICADPYTVYAFASPSNHGLKVGVHVPTVGDDATYKHAWHAVSTAYEQLYGGRWDPSGKDICRLSYVSYDPDLYLNPHAAVFKVPEPVFEPRLPTARPSIRRATAGRHGYAERALQTAAQMIEAAQLGTKHHTRLKAARLLGGYVAGGFLTEEQAYGTLAQALVGHTEDLARALKTVEDGLKYGQAHPLTLETLEVERQVWLDQHFARNRLNPVHSGGQEAPVRPPIGPGEGRQTLSARPYAGYTGYRPYRGYKGVNRHG